MKVEAFIFDFPNEMLACALKMNISQIVVIGDLTFCSSPHAVSSDIVRLTKRIQTDKYME